MSAPTPPAEIDTPAEVLYPIAAESFIEFVRTLSDDQWLEPVPCLPGWDVRDVLSHVSGIPDDAFAGRMEGAPGEAWTASQVERNRHHTVDELIERWLGHHCEFGPVLDAIGEHRPPFDVHAHEHDIRHALGLAGNRNSFVIEVATLRLAQGLETPFRVEIELDDGRTLTSGDGDGEPEVRVRGRTGFELFRSRLGRRSRSQVESYDWTGDAAQIAATIDVWFNFGPAEQPIDEPG